MIQTSKFARKPFYVDAVQVTAENMEEVAKWCEGDLRKTSKPEGAQDEMYIRVRVQKPLNDRQTKAFVGDWVLYTSTGYKVYPPKSFDKSFVPVNEEVSVS